MIRIFLFSLFFVFNLRAVKCELISCAKSGEFVCGKCKYAHYCGRDHQRTDWQYHKISCKKTDEGSLPEKWTVISELEPDARLCLFGHTFAKKIRNESNFRTILPNLTEQDTDPNLEKYNQLFFMEDKRMGVYGFSFTYSGDIEKEFLSHLKVNDVEGFHVMVPACGNGRMVIDALARTKNIQIIANDLNIKSINRLPKIVDYFFPANKYRIRYHNGDMIYLLKSMKNSSIDVIFCSFAIHFLSPEKLDSFIEQSSRVLRPGGYLFLTWVGYEPLEYGELESRMQYLLEPILRENYEKKRPNPGYIPARQLNLLNIGEINVLSKDLISQIAEKNYFTVIVARYSALLSSIGIRGDRLFDAHYAEEPLAPHPTSFPHATMILKKVAK